MIGRFRIVSQLLVLAALGSVCGTRAQSQTTRVLVFPHIADGGGYRTSLLLTNGTGADATASISFFAGSGQPLDVTIGGRTASTFEVPVQANGSAKVATAGNSSSAQTGWAAVTVRPAVALNGIAVFQLFDGGRIVSEASVPSTPAAATAEFFADEEGGCNTGFAMANPGVVAATGSLVLHNLRGEIVGALPVLIEPGHHTAAFLWEIFRSAPSGRAELRLTAGALSVAALRYSASGVFSTASVGIPGAEAPAISALFSPSGGVRARIVAEIDRAASTIDVAIYSFTSNEIREALIAAKNRGVSIRILADASQAGNTGGEIPTLETLGFAVKRMSGIQGGIMHNKYMIVDRRLLFTGSYNWSLSAEENHFENALFLENLPVLRAYEADFERLWSR